MPIILALIAATLFGIADYAGGNAARRVDPFVVTLLGECLGLAGLVCLLPAAGPAPRSLTTWINFGLAGAGSGIGLSLMYCALARGAAAIVSPVAAGVGAVIPVLAGVLGGESLPVAAYFGLGAGCLAVALVSRAVGESGGGRADLAALVIAAGAGICFGVNFALLGHSAAPALIWSLLVTRLGSAIAVFPVAVRHVRRLGVDHRRRLPSAVRRAAWMIAAAGAFDLAANTAYIEGLRDGALSLVAMIASLYPAVTVGLSSWRRGERMCRIQRVGLALAVAALALVSAGSTLH